MQIFTFILPIPMPPFTPEQLVRLGKSLGYKALALTDHETDGGHVGNQARLAFNGITEEEFYTIKERRLG